MGYNEFIHSEITKHKWREFCPHPIDAVVPIVREFYAHILEEGQKTVDRLEHFCPRSNGNSKEQSYITIQGVVSFSQDSSAAVHTCSDGVQRSSVTAGVHHLGPPHRNGGVPVFDTEERLSSKEAITTIAIARITKIKGIRGNQEQPPTDEEEHDPAPQPTTSPHAAASNSRGPKPAELTQSLKMLEQHMSLQEVQQYQAMEMLQQMHKQQQQYWAYAHQRDFAL
ncbi:hypothetical protein TIFTF001_041148 [Ficus carica]|uniref:Uncharacterized protein n=1 Tax=Ficus carica TaxID=3494 RepID=A0AA87Z1Y8_FICCA|nr:hypothetical protein TIFTF001_041148 [Ficus carica]